MGASHPQFSGVFWQFLSLYYSFCAFLKPAELRQVELVGALFECEVGYCEDNYVFYVFILTFNGTACALTARFFNLATIIPAARLNTDMHKHVLHVSLSFPLLTSCSLCICRVFLVCLRRCRERGSVRTSVSHIFSPLTCHVFSRPV